MFKLGYKHSSSNAFDGSSMLFARLFLTAGPRNARRPLCSQACQTCDRSPLAKRTRAHLQRFPVFPEDQSPTPSAKALRIRFSSVYDFNFLPASIFHRGVCPRAWDSTIHIQFPACVSNSQEGLSISQQGEGKDQKSTRFPLSAVAPVATRSGTTAEQFPASLPFLSLGCPYPPPPGVSMRMESPT